MRAAVFKRPLAYLSYWLNTVVRYTFLQFGITLYLLSNGSWSLSAHASVRLDTCIGPEDAKATAIYLHGMDTPSPSAQERWNRVVLNHVVALLSLRVAIVRSDVPCPWEPQLRCWPSTSPDEVRGALDAALLAGQKCFGRTASLGLIGFSNGGFFVSSVRHHVESHPFSYFISFGGAGHPRNATDEVSSDKTPYFIIVGNDDRWHRDRAFGYATSARRLSERVKYIEFNGGHQLYISPLADALAEALMQCSSMNPQ